MTVAIEGRPAPRAPVSVNGVVIPRAAIAQEAQHHPAGSPGASMRAATEALVVRELLRQETLRRSVAAEPATDDRGRRETTEEAAIRALTEQQVAVPAPTADEVARYYASNRIRFRTPDLHEVRHILIPARRSDPAAFAAARAEASAIAAEAAAHPERFADLARSCSACTSAAEGGHLGQITLDETTAEFARALAALADGEMTPEPVETRYGFHIIRLERRFPGRVQPLEAVSDRIAQYLVERSRRLALAQFVARLVSAAEITGVEVAGAEALRVH